jgi:hypothetical protein
VVWHVGLEDILSAGRDGYNNVDTEDGGTCLVILSSGWREVCSGLVWPRACLFSAFIILVFLYAFCLFALFFFQTAVTTGF